MSNKVCCNHFNLSKNACVDKDVLKTIPSQEEKHSDAEELSCMDCVLLSKRKEPSESSFEWFDYEVDSDEEWEEEEPGESLHGSDDEKDEEDPDNNEYDVDNEFMVPHGYLSEEEAQAEDDEDMNPETQKFKLKILGEQFEAEMNAKTSKLKPTVIGCIWQGADYSYAPNIHPKVLQLLKEREIWVSEIPVCLQPTVENESLNESDCGTPSRRLSSAGPGAKKTQVPEEAIPDLIRLVHGNVNGRTFLIKEFMCFWTKKNDLRVSKVSLSKKIREIARWAICTEEGPMWQKYCWYVNEEARKKYLGDDDCGLPNRWTYILTPRKKIEVAADLPDKTEKDDKEKEKEKEKKSVPLITQFTKKFTQEEMKKQLTEAPAIKSTPPLNKKRVALISVARGEKFPKSPRMSLLDKFMVGENSGQSKTADTKNINDDDDIMIIEDNDGKKEDSKSIKQEEALVNIKSEGESTESNKDIKSSKNTEATKRTKIIENAEATRNVVNSKNSDTKNIGTCKNYASAEVKTIECEDDCIMILDDSQDEKDFEKHKETDVAKMEVNVTPSQTVISSEKSDQTQNKDKSRIETSTTN